jgi:hypothetical protein
MLPSAVAALEALDAHYGGEMLPESWAVQLFDREGYYATVIGPTRVDVCAAVDARTLRAPCVACSVPYEIPHPPGTVPDVSLPLDFRAALASLGGKDPTS